MLSVDCEVTVGAFTLRAAFDCRPGDVVALLGPNGAGKSTMLRALAGLLPISSGEVRLGGEVLDAGPGDVFIDAEERRIGYVFQDYALFPHMTVRQNLEFGLRAQRTDRAVIRDRVEHWLRRLDLLEVADQRADQLSGGQAQRCALGRALVIEPKLLLLDEPLSALDAETRLRVRAELGAFLDGLAIPAVLVTHDPLDALVLADQLVVLEGGAVTQCGSVSEVSSRPKTPYVATLMGLSFIKGIASNGVVSCVDGGELVTAVSDISGPVIAAIRPSAVALHQSRPEGSPRNVWQGEVAALEYRGDLVRVEIATNPRVAAAVTPAAVAQLGLSLGARVWVSLKATDVEVYPA